MYYPDLSLIDGSGRGSGRVIAVGWLEPGFAFTTGPVSNEFIDRLACRFERENSWQPALSAGFHRCGFCPAIPGKRFAAGLRTFCVPARDGIYLAPDLIVHYIVKHGYRPPDEFVAAALEAPFPTSIEFFERLHRAGVLGDSPEVEWRRHLESVRELEEFERSQGLGPEG